MGSAVMIWTDRIEEGDGDEEERIDPPRDGACVGTIQTAERRLGIRAWYTYSWRPFVRGVHRVRGYEVLSNSKSQAVLVSKGVSKPSGLM